MNINVYSWIFKKMILRFFLNTDTGWSFLGLCWILNALLLWTVRSCLLFLFLFWQLMPRECINSLFDNFTWTKITGYPPPPGLGRSSVWLHPHVSVFIVLLLFFVMKVSLPRVVYIMSCSEKCMWSHESHLGRVPILPWILFLCCSSGCQQFPPRCPSPRVPLCQCSYWVRGFCNVSTVSPAGLLFILS